MLVRKWGKDSRCTCKFVKPLGNSWTVCKNSKIKHIHTLHLSIPPLNIYNPTEMCAIHNRRLDSSIVWNKKLETTEMPINGRIRWKCYIHMGKSHSNEKWMNQPTKFLTSPPNFQGHQEQGKSENLSQPRGA